MPKASRLTPILASAFMIIAAGVFGLFYSARNSPEKVRATNESAAMKALVSLTTVEAVFREDDLDRNGVKDYWTGDLAGLFRWKGMGSGDRKDLPLIERALAEADAAPINPLVPRPVPYHGYYFVALRDAGKDADPGLRPYQQDTGGTPLMGKVHHLSKFAFCAYPAEFGKTGRSTFVIDDSNQVFISYGPDTHVEESRIWPIDKDYRKHWRLPGD